MIDLNQFSHSHDSLEIVHRGQMFCVLKTFRSDLDRAKRNVEKQRLFRPLYTGLARLSAADVLEFRVQPECAELLMPYVEGITGHMLPVHATRNLAHTLSTSLSTLLYAELNDSREQDVPIQLFLEKLFSVSNSTSDPELKRLISKCSSYVESLPSELKFPIGPCHGDLTLSNVILNSVSGVTLIDFLDTYLESPLQDVAKLKQDFDYGWSFRKAPPSMVLKAQILCRYQLPHAVTQIERMYPVQVRLLTLMTLARIAPYIKDECTREWLIDSINGCLGGSSK
jgi:hypothetical protein